MNYYKVRITKVRTATGVAMYYGNMQHGFDSYVSYDEDDDFGVTTTPVVLEESPNIIRITSEEYNAEIDRISNAIMTRQNEKKISLETQQAEIDDMKIVIADMIGGA